MTTINVFSLSLGISLSRTHTVNYLPYHILSLSCTRSLILSKILVAKAGTARFDLVLKVCRTNFLWRDIFTSLSFSQSLYLVLSIVLRDIYIYIYFYIYLYVYQVKATSVFNIKSLMCYRNSFVRKQFGFIDSKQAMPSLNRFINPE